VRPGMVVDLAIGEDLPLRVRQGSLRVETQRAGFTDLTASVANWLERISAADGLLTVFVRHTSASLTIQENADPDVQADLLTALARLAPEDAGYRHDAEGPDDMPAHIKAALTSSSLSVPVAEGALLLGTWQALYVIEHRAQPHRRDISLVYLGSITG